MFRLFKKKADDSPPQCNHKYKDFPWYIKVSEYETGRYSYDCEWKYTLKVVAPYVCVKCKHRRDEQLMFFESRSSKTRDAKVKELQEQYPEEIRPFLEIEGMIKDEQLVDREYLKLLEEFKYPEDKFADLDLFSEVQQVKKEVAAIGLVTKIGE